MSTQPIGIRVVCDSCRNHIDTTPGVPMRDICPACIEHAQRGEA